MRSLNPIDCQIGEHRIELDAEPIAVVPLSSDGGCTGPDERIEYDASLPALPAATSRNERSSNSDCAELPHQLRAPWPATASASTRRASGEDRSLGQRQRKHRVVPTSVCSSRETPDIAG